MRQDIAPVFTAAHNLAVHNLSDSENNRTFVMVGLADSDLIVQGLKSAGIKTIKHVAAVLGNVKNEEEAAGTVFCVRFNENHEVSANIMRACRLQNHGSVVLAVLSQNASGETAQAALEAGADDFIFDSASAKEIMLRCVARTGSSEKQMESVHLGDLTVDAVGRLVKAEGGTRFLSPIDFRIVHVLAIAGGNVVTREKIKDECWKSENVSDNAVNRKIHEVRRIISAISKQVGIRTVYGLGFALVKEST